MLNKKRSKRLTKISIEKVFFYRDIKETVKEFLLQHFVTVVAKEGK